MLSKKQLKEEIQIQTSKLVDLLSIQEQLDIEAVVNDAGVFDFTGIDNLYLEALYNLDKLMILAENIIKE
jgi:hypothetical protein